MYLHCAFYLLIFLTVTHVLSSFKIRIHSSCFILLLSNTIFILVHIILFSFQPLLSSHFPSTAVRKTEANAHKKVYSFYVMGLWNFYYSYY
jgi:hypothetical protein